MKNRNKIVSTPAGSQRFIPVLRNRATEKIRGFLRLKEGWRYGKGKPFSGEIALVAQLLNSEALVAGFTTTDAFPGVEGNIAVAVYDDRAKYEFDIQAANRIRFTSETNDDQSDDVEEELTFDAAKELIHKLRWTTSFLFTFQSTTEISEDSEANVSKIQAMEAGSQLLQSSASWIPPARFANTQSYTIKLPSLEPRFFGTSNQPLYSVDVV